MGTQPQDAKRTISKTWFIVIGGGLVTIPVVTLIHIFLKRDNALQEEYSFSLWHIFLPLIIIALIYFHSIVLPKKAREKGRELDCRPVFWHSYSILSSLLFGALITFMIQGTLVASMDVLNKDPIQVESVILGIGHSKHCQIKVDLAQERSLCVHFTGHEPVRTPWNFNNMTKDQINKLRGQKVILMGRKSFAGTVIDEIGLPSSDQKRSRRRGQWRNRMLADGELFPLTPVQRQPHTVFTLGENQESGS
jgi:hypothetical protein